MTTKTKTMILVLLAMLISAMIISACGPKEPEVDIDAQKTGFAQTADVQASMTAEARPTATETPEPSPTFTSTPEQSPTPEVTATEAGTATSTAAASGADVAAWRANDPPDNTVFAPGEEFTVTWTIENVGTSTWTKDYYIEFTSGEQMGAEEQVFLPYAVPPGTNVQISVDFVAPDTTGEKRSDWKLFNANDVSFYDFYIIIEVSESGDSEPDAPTATAEPTPTATTAP